MLDIHSHLIFGTDDGSSCLEESIRMIETAKKNGIGTIIATPHFQIGIFSNDHVLEKYELLVERAADYGMDIRLGNEVLADDKLINIIHAVKSINFVNSQRMLVELPYNTSFENAARLIQKIASYNIKILIAHPERNRKIVRNLRNLINMIHAVNCQVQIDAGSIAGVYGVLVKEAACQLLKARAVDYMASNAHCVLDYKTIFPAAVDKIYQLCDEEYAVKLLNSNPPEIINIGGGAVDHGREIG
jgi:protein-tyrosine phosphatase